MSELIRSSRTSQPGRPLLRFRNLQHYLTSLISRLTGSRQLDFTTISTLFAITAALAGSLRTLHGVGGELYWWAARSFTASITLDSNDRIYGEVLSWLESQVVEPRGVRTHYVTSEVNKSTGSEYRVLSKRENANNMQAEIRPPIQYHPFFRITWFVQGGRFFVVHRGTARPDLYSQAKIDVLTILHIGRSVTPLRTFLNACREFVDKRSRSSTKVHTPKQVYNQVATWDTILRPTRPLDTVHLAEAIKNDLVEDIEKYMEPENRRFYMERGIPYRKGYLFYGPPGTGKTSLVFAVAGKFGLDLYVVHLPSTRTDRELEAIFMALPPMCVVLLEDIDAIGINKRLGASEGDYDAKDYTPYGPPALTLSGLLNVLDGAKAQEGRIVIMTSNFADRLDKALLRPGRIDKKIFLGHISHRTAELMFLGMFGLESGNQTLAKLALEFSQKIPESILTPAQVQGYLLDYRDSPRDAAANVSGWIEEEQAKLIEAEVLAEHEKFRARVAKVKQTANANG